MGVMYSDCNHYTITASTDVFINCDIDDIIMIIFPSDCRHFDVEKELMQYLKFNVHIIYN